jgi:hypothetical protein
MTLAMAEIAYESSDDLWVPAMVYESSAGISDQRWPVSPAINYNIKGAPARARIRGIGACARWRHACMHGVAGVEV